MIHIVIVGPTGLVGRELSNLCRTMKFNDKVKYYFVASENSIGNTFYFQNNPYIIKSLENLFQIISIESHSKKYIFVNCANNSVAEDISTFIKYMNSNNLILIDNSSQFRLDENVPLIIPEINF